MSEVQNTLLSVTVEQFLVLLTYTVLVFCRIMNYS